MAGTRNPTDACCYSRADAGCLFMTSRALAAHASWSVIRKHRFAACLRGGLGNGGGLRCRLLLRSRPV